MNGDKPYRKFYRIRRGRIVTGLCQGLGEYFAVDPVIIRLVVLLLIFSPVALATVLLYFIFSLLVPLRMEDG